MLTNNQNNDYYSINGFKKFIIECVGNKKFRAENTVLFQVDKIPQEATSVVIINCFMKTCNGLGFNTNITHMELVNNNIRNVQELAQMCKLDYLDLSGNSIDDVSPLKECLQIKVLKLANNKLTAVDVIRFLNLLQDLDIQNNFIETQEPLYSHRNFNVKWVSVQQITDGQTENEIYTTRMIVKYRDAVVTDKDGSQLIIQNDQELVSLGFLMQLKALKVYINSCHNVCFVEAPQNIILLGIFDSDIKSLHGIEKYQSLTSLTLRDDILNRISYNLDLISQLQQLQYLDIAQNSLEDINWVSKLNALTYINASQNSISQITGLACMKKLTYVDLSYNNIELICLGELTGLKELNISYNQIKLINNLGKLVNLEFLNISNNFITEIAVCLNMASLKELRTDNNAITDFSLILKHTNIQFSWLAKQHNSNLLFVPEDFILALKYKNNIKNLKNNNKILKIQNEPVLADLGFTKYLSLNQLDILNCKNINLEQKIYCKILHIKNSELQTIEGIQINEFSQLLLNSNNISSIQPLILWNSQLNFS
ncbi:leucine-rich_repeat domain-containing protein [Hexamita inflata]|uniref:Leucine-rich repeat domain-containing protein n=1 Tax=Hexamita inflata TaxID=28002 RepID=A0AA86TLD0_9EUKA|nr:leucine-rich repeat domain-containing protein [Hexamita inflata]